MENNNKKISKKVLWTRIFCGFLAFLMVAGVAYLSVELIVDAVKTAKAEAAAYLEYIESHEQTFEYPTAFTL